MSSRINPPGPVVLGSIRNLICEASVGDLPIYFTWTDPYGTIVLFNNTNGTVYIYLYAIEEYGVYTCTATNAIGMNITVFDVVIAGTVITLLFLLYS